MNNQFEDSFLHDPKKLGGLSPVGAGSPGGSVWTVTPMGISGQPQFSDTSLNDLGKLGGVEPVGAGSPGGVIWRDSGMK